MLEINFYAFLLSSVLIIVLPGPDMILIITRCLTINLRNGIISNAGISLGLLGHTLLAAGGVGALLLSSVFLFSMLKIIGVIYLIYLGIKLFIEPPTSITLNTPSQQTSKAIFLEGFFTNMTNPKIILFFFAFLPQFIGETTSNATLMLFLLGLLYTVLSFVILCLLALLISQAKKAISNINKVLSLANKCGGLVFIGFGISLALQRH